MKKKSLKTLEIKRKVISQLQSQNVVGGVDKDKITNPCPSNITK